MEDFVKVSEMTADEAKKLDLNKIEYIALSSGEIIYLKKPEQKAEAEEHNEPQKEEELKEMQPNEKEES